MLTLNSTATVVETSSLPQNQTASALDFITPAKEGGWRQVEVCSPMSDLWAGAVYLTLGHQTIPVRLLVYATDASTEANQMVLQKLLEDMTYAYEAEQYLVLEGFPPELVRLAKLHSRAAIGLCIHVSDYQGYARWARLRLGPLATMPVNSPVRTLVEPMLELRPPAAMAEAVPPAKCFAHSRIGASFSLGHAGCSAFETMLRIGLGRSNVVNVEDDVAYQVQDVDLLASSMGAQVRVEVKTESYYANKNLSYEWVSNMTKDSPGWLSYSTAEVLVSIIWPTGDVFVQDFAQVKEWVIKNSSKLRCVSGKVPGQNYCSQVYLGNANDVCASVPGIIHMSIHDWLPHKTLADSHPSILHPNFCTKTLRPMLLQ